MVNHNKSYKIKNRGEQRSKRLSHYRGRPTHKLTETNGKFNRNRKKLFLKQYLKKTKKCNKQKCKKNGKRFKEYDNKDESNSKKDFKEVDENKDEKNKDEKKNDEQNNEEKRPTLPGNTKRPKNTLKRPNPDDRTREHSEEGSKYPLTNSDSSSDDEEHEVKKQRKEMKEHLNSNRKDAENRNRQPKKPKELSKHLINEEKQKKKH